LLSPIRVGVSPERCKDGVGKNRKQNLIGRDHYARGKGNGVGNEAVGGRIIADIFDAEYGLLQSTTTVSIMVTGSYALSLQCQESVRSSGSLAGTKERHIFKTGPTFFTHVFSRD
jgi:hypothetical protein